MQITKELLSTIIYLLSKKNKTKYIFNGFINIKNDLCMKFLDVNTNENLIISNKNAIDNAIDHMENVI